MQVNETWAKEVGEGRPLSIIFWGNEVSLRVEMRLQLFGHLFGQSYLWGKIHEGRKGLVSSLHCSKHSDDLAILIDRLTSLPDS